ncbi:MFS transporter [Streptomyces fractus]|uniref:MFS transporter n=1 Tax=Streptomyces fractus TaxID=641806 RepID=UPI003CFA1852
MPHSPASPGGSAAADLVNARIDRLPRWGLSRVAFVILGLAYFIDIYDITIIGYTLTAMTKHFGLSTAEVTVMLTGNAITTALGAFLFGSLGDILGRRRTYLLGMAALGTTALLCAFAWSAESLVVLRVVTGFATGGGLAVCTSYVQESSPAKRRGRYVSITVLASSVGGLAAALLSGWLVPLNAEGWRWVYGVGALAFVLMLGARRSVLPESARWLALKGRTGEANTIVAAMESRLRRSGHTLPEPVVEASEAVPARFPVSALLRPPYLQRLLVAAAFWFGVQWSVRATTTFQPTILGQYGMNLSTVATITSVGQVAGIVGYLLTPLVVDRLERRTLIVTGLLIATASTVVITAGGGSIFAYLVAAVMLHGFASLIFVPGYNYAAEIFPTHARATGASLAGGLGQVGGIVQSLVLVPVVAGAGAATSQLLIGSGYAFAALVVFLLAIPTTGRALSAISAAPGSRRKAGPTSAVPDREREQPPVAGTP